MMPEGAGGKRRISTFLEKQRFFTPLRSVQNDITRVGTAHRFLKPLK